MLDAKAESDGRITVSVGGQKVNAPLVKGDDGQWYLDGSALQ